MTKMQKKKNNHRGMGKGFFGLVGAVAAVYAILSFYPEFLERGKIEKQAGLERKLETKVVQPVEVNDVNEVAEVNESNNINYVIKTNDIDYNSLYEMTVRHEGFRDTAYNDSEGILTIGFGFNLEKEGARERIESLGLDYEVVCNKNQKMSFEQAHYLMKEDVGTAISDAKSYVGENWEELHPKAKEIIIDMSYNLGRNRLSGFKKLREALRNYDYQKASKEMQDSKWYHQTGNRAKELVEKMRNIN